MHGATWWLRDATGVRRRIPASGVLIGRSSGCDIVLGDPAISRHHALVYLESGAPKLMVLGSGHVRVAGTIVDDAVTLAPTEQLEVGPVSNPSERRVETGTEVEATPRFLLQLVRGGAYPVKRRRFTIGGGDTRLAVSELCRTVRTA